MEIEKKFLITSTERIPFDLHQQKNKHIRQGYITINESFELRLRAVDQEFILTKKSIGDNNREEIEISLDEETFDRLWTLVQTTVISKQRYYIPHEIGLIELDIYDGDLQGLITAEVEFSTLEEMQSASFPEWLSHDITEDSRYKNRNLATQGIPRNVE